MKNILLILTISFFSVSFSFAKEKIVSSEEIKNIATFIADGEILSLTESKSEKGVKSCNATFRVITPLKGDRKKGEVWKIKFKIHPKNYEGGRVPAIKVGNKFRLYADNVKVLGDRVEITLNRNSVKFEEFAKSFSK